MKYIVIKLKKIILLFINAAILVSIYLVINKPNAVKTVIYPAYRESIKESLVQKSMDFCVMETEKFKIFYKQDSSSNMKEISDSAQKNLSYLEKDFNYMPAGKINLVIYTEYKEVADKMGLNYGSNAAGAYYSGIISLCDKFFIEKKMNNISSDSLMLHELTHYILDYIAAGNIPAWFTEGIALFEEYNTYGYEWAKNKEYKSYYNPWKLGRYYYELNEVKAYKQSFLIVKYITGNFGMEVIRAILMELGAGRTMNQAVEKILNMDIYDLFEISLGANKIEGYLQK